MEVNLKDYSLESEYISVQAADREGNKSNVVQVRNPYYTPQPITPGGSATVIDNTTDADGKEFFTFSTPEENVFYLVVDRQRETENVYFLNAVTEDDLMALAQKDDGKGSSGRRGRIMKRIFNKFLPGGKNMNAKINNRAGFSRFWLSFVLTAAMRIPSACRTFRILE